MSFHFQSLFCTLQQFTKQSKHRNQKHVAFYLYFKEVSKTHLNSALLRATAPFYVYHPLLNKFDIKNIIAPVGYRGMKVIWSHISCSDNKLTSNTCDNFDNNFAFFNGNALLNSLMNFNWKRKACLLLIVSQNNTFFSKLSVLKAIL